MDDKSYFTAEEENGETIRIPNTDGYLIFTPDLFDNASIKVDSVKLTIRYVEEEYNDTTLVTNIMNIVTIPLDIN